MPILPFPSKPKKPEQEEGSTVGEDQDSLKKSAAGKDIEMDDVANGQDAAANLVQEEEGLAEKITASKKSIESTSSVGKEESAVRGAAKCTEPLQLPEWLPTTTHGNPCKKCFWQFFDLGGHMPFVDLCGHMLSSSFSC